MVIIWPADFSNILTADAVWQKNHYNALSIQLDFCSALMPYSDEKAVQLFNAGQRTDYATRNKARNEWLCAVQSLRQWQENGGAPHAISFMMSFQNWLYLVLTSDRELLDAMLRAFHGTLRQNFPEQQDLNLPLMASRQPSRQGNANGSARRR